MPTLQTYIEEFAKEVGPFAKGTADNSGGTTSQLVCSSWPFLGHNDGTYFYRDQYLWIPSSSTAADRLRFVSAYTPSTGGLTVDTVWSNVTAWRNIAFQVHGVFDPLNEVIDLLNKALMRCFYIVEVSFVPADNLITRTDLTTAAPWLEDPAWVVGAMKQTAYASYPREQYEPPPMPYEVVRDGNSIYLRTGRLQTTDKVYVQVLKPAYYMTTSGAGFTVGTGTTLTDTSPVPVEWLKAGAIVEAWKRYEHILEPRAAAKLVASRKEASEWFTEQSLMHFHMPSDTQQHYDLMPWGPRW